MLDEIIKEISGEIPQFNDHLLNEYPKQQTLATVDFLAGAFKEAMKFLRDKIVFEGYRILQPKERVTFELFTQRSGAYITNSELMLIAYEFSFEGKSFISHIYLPYLTSDNTIVIRNIKYSLMYGITEKIFSRHADYITIRVIRQPLQFSREINHFISDVNTNETINDFIVSTKLHTRKPPKKNIIKTTIVHYMLAQFGFEGTLFKFGLDRSHIDVVDTISDDIEKYNYYTAKASSPKNKEEQMLYLKVDKVILEDITYKRLVINICYILSAYNKHILEDLFESSNTTYLTYLGELLYPNQGPSGAKNHADTHIYSVDKFIDPATKNRLHTFGVNVDNIWDLIQYVFIDIDKIMVNSTPQNLYDKRITLTDLFMIESFITPIYKKVYHLDQRPNQLSEKELSRLINLRATTIRGMNRAANVAMVSSGMINENRLLSYALQKLRLSGSKSATPSLNSEEARFHTSTTIIENSVGFSGKLPGVTGTLNPYTKIDDNGGIIKQPYADDLDELSEYLPY